MKTVQPTDSGPATSEAFRTIPQYMGPVHDTIYPALKSLTTELNSAPATGASNAFSSDPTAAILASFFFMASAMLKGSTSRVSAGGADDASALESEGFAVVGSSSAALASQTAKTVAALSASLVAEAKSAIEVLSAAEAKALASVAANPDAAGGGKAADTKKFVDKPVS